MDLPPPPASIPLAAVAAAAERRSCLRAEGHTALRIFHSAGDGVPGLWIDDFGGCWLVQTTGSEPPLGIRALMKQQGVRGVYWKQLSHQRDRSPVHVAGIPADKPFDILEGGLRYQIDFSSGYSQGLFLDQRENRALVRAWAQGLRVLNTFAYTCGFGVAAAAGGAAESVNLDLSKHYLTWGRTNYALNGLPTEERDFIFGDTMDWLERFAKRGRRFDLVILDPPSFSRGSGLGGFSVARDYQRLASLALAVLSPGGRLLACANEHRLLLSSLQAQIAAASEATSFAIADATDTMATDFPGSHYLKRLIVTDDTTSGQRHPPGRG